MTNKRKFTKVIIKILREDIKSILAMYKDLEKAEEKAEEEAKWKQVSPYPQKSISVFVSNWAKFIDGQSGIDKYIADNLEYPEKEKKKGKEEEIVLLFEVKPDGNIGEISILQGRNEAFVNEAKRLIKNMPKWKPAIQKGKPISTYYSQKIKFEISNTSN